MSTLSQAKDDDQGTLGSIPRMLHVIASSGPSVAPESEEHVPHGPALAPVACLERREKRYRRWLGFGDGLACLASTLLITALSGLGPTWGMIFVAPFSILVSKIEGLYDRDDQVIQKTNIAEWRKVLQTAGLCAIGIYLSWEVLTDASHGGGMRLFLALAVGSFALAVSFRSIARYAARTLSDQERCVIVGDPARSIGLAHRLEAAKGVELVGMLAENSLTGSVAELRSVVEELNFHRLLIAPSGEPNESTLHLIQAARFIGVRVSLVPSVMTAVGGFATIEELDGTTLLGVPRFGLSRSSNALKRVFDLVLGSLALLAFGPIMLAIAIAIRMDSRGPILFRQTRIGRGGKPFEILKFRSMVDGADALKDDLRKLNEARDGLFKIAQDPRITRIGRQIRSAHLDELPQLVNVLRGEMSLVGPRPLVAEEDARVKGRDRHRVHLTPGITGPWQIRGPMNTPLSEMAMLDYRYASDWSIWQDLDILLQTALRVIDRGGH